MLRRNARSRSSPPIPRSVDRASRRGLFRAQVAPTEPSGRRWTRGGWTCTPEVNLAGEMCHGSSRRLERSPDAELDEICESSSRSRSLRHSSVKPCSIKVAVQRLYNLSGCGSPTINPTTLARKLLSRNDSRHRKYHITDCAIHSGCEAVQCRTKRLRCAPSLQETPTPCPWHV